MSVRPLSPRPVVIAAHGTRSVEGQRTIAEVAARLGERLSAEVRVGWIDVLEPTLDEVVATLDEPVVVPWLVGGGYHLLVDVTQAAERAPGSTVLPPVGDSPALVEALADRLGVAQAAGGSGERRQVALVWAGSSTEVARERVAGIAERLGERLGRPVHAVALSAASETADEALVRLRVLSGSEPVVASLLLAPGHFFDRALALPVEVISEPVGAHEALIEAVARQLAQL